MSEWVGGVGDEHGKVTNQPSNSQNSQMQSDNFEEILQEIL